MKAMVFALVLLAAPAGAQELAAIDPRIATLPIDQAGMLQIRTAGDVTQTLLFRPGERIASVILSDPSAYQVLVAGAGDSLALRATGPSSFGVMTVRTNLRSYEFELLAGGVSSAPAVVRLMERPASSRPRSPAPAVGTAERFTYRVSGSKALRPTAISDDGAKTYIEWAHDQAMPATFALGPTGDEQMVDGYVRDGIYTIDRVYKTLIFRIDKDRAAATRLAKAGTHG